MAADERELCLGLRVALNDEIGIELGKARIRPEMSNGVQKGPPIGVEEGPPFSDNMMLVC